MGGAALADFDTLIELITSTIKPDTWDEVGGPGAIEPFPTNLSLVISQTQDVQLQRLTDYEQLRRPIGAVSFAVDPSVSFIAQSLDSAVIVAIASSICSSVNRRLALTAARNFEERLFMTFALLQILLIRLSARTVDLGFPGPYLALCSA